jgi:hypothetical protein
MRQGKTWIDDFLAYRDDFEFAPASREVMQAFEAVRAEHKLAQGIGTTAKAITHFRGPTTAPPALPNLLHQTGGI